MSKKSQSQLMDIVGETYSSSQLPHFWEVVYQEGLRGNHIPFLGADPREYGHGPVSTDLTAAAEIVYQLLSRSTVSELQRCIALLDIQQKRDVFAVYKHLLRAWNTQHLSQLN
jgi:hypothetical protein